jgi:hypothetical protein
MSLCFHHIPHYAFAPPLWHLGLYCYKLFSRFAQDKPVKFAFSVVLLPFVSLKQNIFGANKLFKQGKIGLLNRPL